MLELQSLRLLTQLSIQEQSLIAAVLAGVGVFCSLLVINYGMQGSGIKDFCLKFFSLRILGGSFIFCIVNFLFCVWLYSYTPYAWFVFGILCGFYVLSYIDCLLLKIPDLLNFAVLFFVWGGLYYFDLLTQEHILASLALAGSFALIRILGSFIFGKEIMGEADIVVLASMGAVVGVYWSIYLVLFSSIVAMGYILLRGMMGFKDRQISIREIRIPFVLFLMVGLVLVLFCLRSKLLEGLSA